MWFIGVEVEQETSAPPPKKNLDPLLKRLKENLNKGYQKVDKLLLNILREVFVSLNSSFYLFIYYFFYFNRR